MSTIAWFSLLLGHTTQHRSDVKIDKYKSLPYNSIRASAVRNSITRFPSNSRTSQTRITNKKKHIKRQHLKICQVQNQCCNITLKKIIPNNILPLSHGIMFTKIDRNHGPDTHATCTPK